MVVCHNDGGIRAALHSIMTMHILLSQNLITLFIAGANSDLIKLVVSFSAGIGNKIQLRGTRFRFWSEEGLFSN